MLMERGHWRWLRLESCSFGDEQLAVGLGTGWLFLVKAARWRVDFLVAYLPVPYAGSDPHSADQRTGD
jgi:hypothetical protein